MAGPEEGRAVFKPELPFSQNKRKHLGCGGELVSQFCAGEEREAGMKIKPREIDLKRKGQAYEKYIPLPKEDGIQIGSLLNICL